TDVESLRKGLLLSKKYPEVVNVGCTTPHDVEKEGESSFSEFDHAARSGHLKAIGETGLDYHYLHSSREIQKIFLKKYLALAVECDLPVVFHCREAFSDLFAIADDCYLGKSAILHCFTGTADEANEVIRRGWMISFSGILTFKKSESLREIAKTAPLSQILIETDSPYLAPQSQRGKINEPAFLPETAACIAKVKGISLSEVAGVTVDNARRFFRLFK
ncbi:MAG: TatD family hydrolase, partial [Chlamydiae bacterium]|nr:TatD family hydrolase [Chlamydiota bacterium]